MRQPLATAASSAGTLFALCRHALRWENATLLLAALASSAFIFPSVSQHRAYNSNGWDLGWFDQVIWNTAHGRLFETSLAPWNFIGEHFQPVLLLFAALYRLHPDPEALLVVQAIVAAGAAVPLFHAARVMLRSEAAAFMVSAAYIAAGALWSWAMFSARRRE